MKITGLWEAWFLEERPSASLGLFRVALAATIGLHVLPTLLHLEDNYLAGAFREPNPSFFTYGVLAWVDSHPDWLVRTMAWLFAVSWLSFLLGLWTRASAILTALGCYYFYARNSLHVGTLSWDILLVTLFLALLTDYLGDSFSLDSARRQDPEPFRRKRPFFLQRLLQLQIASTYFYTGLHKITAGGNWLLENPYYYLMHDPPTGVMKSFPFRDFLAASPQLCYALGLACIAWEITLPLWLFWRKTRPWAVAAAILFQFWLLITMHVPTIFFFLFPPQLLLFIDPEKLVSWLDSRRAARARRGRPRL